MRIFLTGGTGFIGSHFLKCALAAGLEVRALRRNIQSKPRIALPFQPEWITKSMTSVRTSDLTDIDLLIHLAAHSANFPYDSLEKCLYWNLNKPLELFEKARLAGIKKFLMTGSCFEYGTAGLRYDYIPPDAPLEPTQSYPASKAAASIAISQWAKSHRLWLTIARLFQVYGEGEAHSRLWPSLCSAAISGNDFPMTLGDQVRDFCHVSIIAEKLLSMCEELMKCSRTEYVSIRNLGSGEEKTVRDFAQKIWKEHGGSGKILFGAIPYRTGEVMRYVPKL
jgi:nucleoside-diphosphate-sugar epimerase